MIKVLKLIAPLALSLLAGTAPDACARGHGHPPGRLPADFAAQCERAMDNVEALLAAAGMTTANIVELNYYATQATDFPTLVQIRQRRWAFDLRRR